MALCFLIGWLTRNFGVLLLRGYKVVGADLELVLGGAYKSYMRFCFSFVLVFSVEHV